MAALRFGLCIVAALGWAAPALGQGVERWSAEIARASARVRIPEDWIRRVMRVESGGRPLFRGKPVVSPAGAMGLMQLMPATWRDMRELLGLGSDPHDPADNILAGAAYLRLLYDRFGYPGLFAAYNAGPARYSSVLYGRARLPAETRAYLDRIAMHSVPARSRPPTARLLAARSRASPLFASAAASRTMPFKPSAPALFVKLNGNP